MTQTLLTALRDELERLIAPLVKAVDDIAVARRLLRAVGADESFATKPALLTALAAAVELRARVDAVVDAPDPSLTTVAAALEATADLFSTLRDIDVSEADLERLGTDLIEVLTGEYLHSEHPLIDGVGAVLTLIEIKEDPSYPLKPGISRNGQIVRFPFPRTRLRFDRLREFVNDPGGTLRAAYFPNGLATIADANAGADRLFPRLGDVLTQLDVIWAYGLPDEDRTLLGDAAALVDHAFQVYVPAALTGSDLDAGITFTLSSDDQGGLGLVLSPFGALEFSKQVGRIQFDCMVGAEIQALAIGAQGATFLATADTANVNASFKAAVVPETAGAPAFVLGAATGTRLEVGSAQLGAAISASLDEAAVTVSVDASSGALVIARGDGDGFINRILPADGVRAEFDLGLAWSNSSGLTLRGGAGLEAALPINRSLGGLKLSTVYVNLFVEDGRVAAEVSASLGLSLGPLQAAVDRIGLIAALTFPDTGGNLGVVDLDVSFKPPSGVGLAIDASAVVGGGYLYIDPAKGEYSGMVLLEIAGRISVKAFGLLSTRLPDGTRGYSLIVVITAEGFQPIALGMGFFLTGIGGLVAINRTFDENAMREGLRTDTLGRLLFPAGGIADAPQILRSLATVFPARSGSYLFGPLVRIDWSSPALIRMQLALILELGARRRLIVLGRISANLPTREEDLVRLNMDVLGILDFDQGTISLDAVLVDSRLAHKYVLTGSMAMRACVVPGRAAFALAIGGMNPHFTPPTTMPALDRLTISLTSGTNPRLTCEAYFALTANTIQFGARAQLYAAAYGFSIEGDIGFDVLIQLLPFHFLAEFHASIQLKQDSRSLFKVTVNGELDGPRPLRVSAKATFEILCCDFSIRFDKTLIEGEKPPLPPAIDGLAELTRALASAGNWSTQTPSAPHGVTVRAQPGDATMTLDPLGELTVRQTVVPLNTARDLETFGGAPLTGAPRFTVSALVNGDMARSRPATDLFAPAQFFAMSDEEKLASPSFEEMESGLVFSSDAMAIEDAAVNRADAPLVYDTLILDEQGTATPAQPYQPDETVVLRQARFASVAQATARKTGLSRFRNDRAARAVTVVRPGWRIVSTEVLTPAAPEAVAMTWGNARAAAKTLGQRHPSDRERWQIIPEYEVVS